MSELEARLSRYRQIVDDWQAFLAACRRPLPTVVWANPFRAEHMRRLEGSDALPPDASWCKTAAQTTDLLVRRLERRGLGVERIAWCPGALRVEGFNKPGITIEHYLGLMHVQEEISLAPAPVLAPQPGERVLDLCAAPGGKTAQIAVQMEGRGTVVANDVRPQRLRALRSNSDRLGLHNVVVTPIDGTRFPMSDETPFDRILLDVPCSCEGNLRQQSGGGRQAGSSFLRGRSGLQATLLGRAWRLLRPGGILVYATCTFAPEENELVLDYCLGDDAEILAVDLPGLSAAPGVTEWDGKSLRSDCTNVARYWPHLNDTGGFTVARVRRRPVPKDEAAGVVDTVEDCG